jgi:hypothetical protein
VKELSDLALRQTIGSARARYDSFKEVYGSAGLLTPELLRECGREAVSKLSAKQIVDHLNTHHATRGLVQEDALAIEQQVASQFEAEKSRFLLDVEIDATHLETQSPTKTPVATSITETEYDVFISFATVDRETAHKAFDLFEQGGLRVFFSPKGLEGGDDWEEKIRLALIGSREICLIVSKASLPREWVLAEWGAAWATAKRITPVLVDVEAGELPSRLQSKQCIRVHQLETYASQTVQRIKGSIEKH